MEVIFKDIFHYNNGKLYWKVKPKSGINIGDEAGWLNTTGYLQVCYKRKKYSVHKIVWELFNGEVPIGFVINHIDVNPLNNKIENLRLGSMAQNQYNHSLRKDNTSGIKGVSFSKDKNKWRVQLKVNKKALNFGCHEDIEFAELVAHEARVKYHGRLS